MDIKIKHVGHKKLIKEIHEITGYSDSEIIENIVGPIFQEYYHYCTTHFKNFLIKAGFNKDFKIIVLWQDRCKTLAYVSFKEVEIALKNNKPIIMHISIYDCMNILKELLDSSAKNYISILAEFFNGELIDAIVHETVHLAQVIIKTINAYTQIISNLDKDIRSNNKLVIDFIEIVNSIHKFNQQFLRYTKLEGEAMYFGQNYSSFYRLRKYPGNNFIDMKKDIKKSFEKKVKKMEILLKEHVAELRLFNKNLKKADELVKDITNIMLNFQNNLNEDELIKNADIYKKKEEILSLKIKELSETIPHMEISNEFSKIIKYEGRGLHELGYIIVYALKEAKIHRYDMNINTMLDKFTNLENIKEIKNLRFLIIELVILINDTEKMFRKHLELIPKDELAMKRFNEIIHKNIK